VGGMISFLIALCPFVAMLPEDRADDRQGVVLVDARRATSFKNGSIRNAINVPVDSSLAHREEVLAKINRNEEIVVFCQSENCEYSDKIARFLKFNGFKKVQIYRNGIREWEDKKVVNDRS